MKTTLSGAIIFVVLCGFSFSSMAQMPVDEIVEKANNTAYYAGEDGKASVTMVITDSQGRARRRAFTILRMDSVDGGEQKYYVYFQEPADVSDMVYMVWKRLDKDDDRWMYLPALDLVRRIASSDKRSSFIGSHFVYEDISGRSLSEDVHELLEEREVEFLIRNTPKNPAGVEFSYFDVYIRKDNFIPHRAEFYDSQGEVTRVIEAQEIKEVQGYPTVVKQKATDLVSGGNTVVEFSSIEYDLGFDDTIFTERSLRRPPRKWLK